MLTWVAAAVVVLALVRPGTCLAYVYPEHRQITMIGIRQLDSSRTALLDRLWSEARTEFEARLSTTPADHGLNGTTGTLDYAAWPAIAGDHSCSAAELLKTALTADWILDVSRVAAQLGRNLNAAGVEGFRRINALRASDFELLAVDPDYATRAGSNNAHFLLPRDSTDVSLDTYLLECVDSRREINAIGVYERYHARALSIAKKLNEGEVVDNQRAKAIRAMLADEAFALHFLEDAFAAGHIAGSWGDAPLRKGTHDFYNENGLAVTTWDRQSFVLLGDAWMRTADAETAARSVCKSLEQVLDVVRGNLTLPRTEPETGVSPDTLNVCQDDVLPDNPADRAFIPIVSDAVRETPKPGLATGYGEMPRFNAELGPFVGISSSFAGGWHYGGFLRYQNGVGVVGGVELAVRLGIGLEGVMNESGDGLAFLDLGMLRESASTLKIGSIDALSELGALTAAIPARAANVVRLRVPFFVVPFDLLLAAPVLALTSPRTLTRMAVVAANGGALGWQSGLATSFGRFQIVLGREVSVYLYGKNKDNNRVFAYPEGRRDELYLMDIESFRVILPVLDFRSFRTFSRNQSSAIHVQFFAGANIPTHVGVLAPPDIPSPPSRWVWYLGLRASIDWRYYF